MEYRKHRIQTTKCAGAGSDLMSQSSPHAIDQGAVRETCHGLACVWAIKSSIAA